MRKWFAKQVVNEESGVPSAAISTPGTVASDKAASAPPRHRRTVYAPLLAADRAEAPAGSIRIKAQIYANEDRIVLMVDRPLLTGYSCWSPDASYAATHAPLAAALFAQPGVRNVLIHETNVTVTHNVEGDGSAQTRAAQFGQAIRAHLETGKPIVTETWLASLPSESDVREGLQRAVDEEVNPGIAAHSGEITITAVVGNTAYIKMGGGCQGCAASSITLRQGVNECFRRAVPQLGALLDETDHAAGSNPFFIELPDGMRN